jgi:hypothetical protein
MQLKRRVEADGTWWAQRSDGLWLRWSVHRNDWELRPLGPDALPGNGRSPAPDPSLGPIAVPGLVPDIEPRDGNWPEGPLDQAFPPHSVRRLVLLLVLTPLVSALAALAARPPLDVYVVVTLGGMGLAVLAWLRGGVEHERGNPWLMGPVAWWIGPMVMFGGFGLMSFVMSLSLEQGLFWSTISAMASGTYAALLWIWRKTWRGLILFGVALAFFATLLFSIFFTIFFLFLFGETLTWGDFMFMWGLASAGAVAGAYPMWSRWQDRAPDSASVPWWFETLLAALGLGFIVWPLVVVVPHFVVS